MLIVGEIVVVLQNASQVAADPILDQKNKKDRHDPAHSRAFKAQLELVYVSISPCVHPQLAPILHFGNSVRAIAMKEKS